MAPRLALVGEIPYNWGIKESAGGKGSLRGKGNKIGELLENATGFSQNCLTKNLVKINNQIYSKK